MTIKRLKFDSLSYKTLFIVVFLLLIGIIGLLRLRQQPSSVTASWFDESYSYRKAITVDNTSGSDLTDFQVTFDIGTSALIAQGKMQTDCDDIRITDQNGKLLPHWIEEGNLGCNSPDGDTKVWVKAPSLPTSGATLFVYYGNTIATNVSSIENTFGAIQKISLNSPYTTSPSPHGSYSDTNGTQLTNGVVREELFSNIEATVGWLNQTPSITITLDTSTYLSYFKFHAGGGGTGGINMPTSVNIEYSTDNVVYHQIGVGSSWSNTEQWVTINSKPLNAGKYVKFTFSPNSWIMLGELEIYGYPEANITPNPPTLSLSATEELSPAPIAHWKFDEGVGTTAFDSSGQENHGIITGTTWQTEDQCISGKCLYFDGSSNSINFGNFLNSPNALTVSFWTKINNMNLNEQTLIIKGTTYNGGFSDREWSLTYLTSPSKRLSLEIFKDSAGPIRTQLSVSNVDNFIKENTWHQVTFVWNSGTFLGIYVDGVLRASTSSPVDTLQNSGRPILVGNSTHRLQGFIDEVKIYPYARTQEQILADYNAGLAGVSSSAGSSVVMGSTSSSKSLSDGLVGYWTMDEGVGTTTLDKSGNNNLVTFGSGLSAPSWNTGKYGNGLNFDGVDDYMSADVLSQISDEFTASVWIYPTRLEPQAETYGNTIFATSSSYGLWLLHNNGAIRIYAFSSDAGNHYYQTTATPITLNNWFHIVVTAKRNGEGKIFVNGNFLEYFTAEDDIGLSGVLGMGDLRLGRRLTHEGLLDEVRIYNRALSPTEVKQLYEYAPGPVAHYTFDSGDNTTLNDISGNSNNGTWAGSSSERYTLGKYGKAGSFNGSDDYVNLGTDPFSSIKSITVSTWFKYDSLDRWKAIASKDNNVSGNRGWMLMPASTAGNPLKFHVIDNENHEVSVGNWNTVIGEWHHVAGVFDGETKKLSIYIDGILNQTTIASTVTELNSNNGLAVKIGHWYVSNQYFPGKIDDFKIYNYARTQKQILEDIQGGGPALRQPVIHWKFDEGYGSIANNNGNSSTTNNGTLTCGGTGCNKPSWVNDGKFGKALSFNGSGTTWRSLVNAPSVNLGTTTGNQITFSAWIKPNATQEGSGWIVRNGTGYDENYGINLGNKSAGKFALLATWYDGNFRSRTTTGYHVSENEWSHVTAVLSQGEWIKFFINGSLAEELSWAYGNSVLSTSSFNIGGHNGTSSQYFQGLIDEVKVYNYALSEDEIKLDYNQGSTFVMGSSTQTIGATTTSLEYCIPGDISHCTPPVAEWKFDEGIGTTIIDTSGNGNHGILGTGNSSPSWTIGKTGRALSFGGNDYVDVSHNINSCYNTISFWFKLNSLSTNQPIIGKLYGPPITNYGWGLTYKDNALRGMAASNNTEWYDNLTYNDISLDKWYHASLTFTGFSGTQTGKLYINGKEVASHTGTSACVGQYEFMLGTGQNEIPGGFLNGLLDQVKVYDYVRSPAQIAYDYNRGAPLAHWKLDECQGTTIYDKSGNNLHGTLSVGASGTQTSPGTCQTTDTAWGNGKTGKYNSSLNFDGTDDYILLPNNIFSSVQPFSVSLWAYLNNDTHRLMELRNDIKFVLRVTGTSVQTFCGVSWQTIGSVNLNQWQHMTITFDGTNVVTYINGKYAGYHNEIPTATSSYYNILGIGYDFKSDPTNGQIDDVRIYNYALTSEQVKTLYNNGAVSFQ